MPHFTRKSLLWCLPLLALFASCSEDFTVGAPYKLVTVAYGLMNTADTAHYIRIQKAYYDENGSAIDLAAVSDSSFYAPNSITVTLREINGNTVTNEVLQRVDLNTEGYQKENGVFFNKPNYAYKTKRFLNPDPAYRYRLVIENMISGERDSAETPVLPSNFTVSQFNQGAVVGFNSSNKFILNVTAPENSRFFDGIIRFHWANKASNGTQTDSSADWKFSSEALGEGKTGVVLSTELSSFFSFIRDAVGEAPSGVTRFMDSADLFVWTGSSDFYTFQQINGAQGGLTADQVKTIYTNWKGANVYGLFASRAMRQINRVPLTEPLLDTLMKNPINQALNFKGRSDH